MGSTGLGKEQYRNSEKEICKLVLMGMEQKDMISWNNSTWGIRSSINLWVASTKYGSLQLPMMQGQKHQQMSFSARHLIHRVIVLSKQVRVNNQSLIEIVAHCMQASKQAPYGGHAKIKPTPIQREARKMATSTLTRAVPVGGGSHR
uniref:Uncharacterized protein n=1 Tax=Oryza rufipogon TaxID=4529 RepID=A0A0E0NWE2_ORYRU